jgi:uncharacterized protein (DUF305 family)
MRTATLTAVLAMLAGAAAAQTMPGMGMPAPQNGAPATPESPTAPAAPNTPATKAFQESMMRMHARMDIPYTGDTDQDFVAGMLPHHQGAVDMARVELRYGHDPALKHLARDIVAAQEKEIAFMRRWQAQHLPKHAGE